MKLRNSNECQKSKDFQRSISSTLDRLKGEILRSKIEVRNAKIERHEFEN
jgi:hypothetical protein